MSGQAPNLRPYGGGWSNPSAPGAPAGSFEQQMLDRARYKLAATRAGSQGDRPAGSDLYQVIPAVLVGLLLGAPMFLLAFALAHEKGAAVGVVIFGVLGLLCLCIPVLSWVQSSPTKPKYALKSFYRAIGRGRYKRARALTVRADLDDFPRYQPRMENLGAPSGYPRNFSDEGAFREYWRELTHSHAMPYCIANVKHVRETQVAPDVVIVDFELKLVMNTGLWFLLIFIALLLAVVVDLATRKTVNVHMRKVLVRVGNEWHLLSSEWQAYEENNTQWI
ncbi:MAG: hypothetical protein KDB90_12245 [Planctomycetes bacterium]|nr:hypothetical protein [Planctomycetota bacterium]